MWSDFTLHARIPAIRTFDRHDALSDQWLALHIPDGDMESEYTLDGLISGSNVLIDEKLELGV